MPISTNTSSLHKVRDLADGALVPLGTETLVGGASQDQTLYWVDSAGAVAGGPAYGPHAAATDVQVILPAETGEQVWIYVLNDSGSTIERGQAVSATASTAPYKVSAAPVSSDPAVVVGVAQHDIGDDQYGWILRKGTGEVLADGSVTAGTALVISAGTAGSVTDTGGVTQASIGWSTEADAGATLVTARIDCRG